VLVAISQFFDAFHIVPVIIYVSLVVTHSNTSLSAYRPMQISRPCLILFLIKLKAYTGHVTFEK